MPAQTVGCQIDLPVHYRTKELLAFHSRDNSQTDAWVRDRCIHKAIYWNGNPACITIDCTAAIAIAELSVDGPVEHGDAERLKLTVNRMLGLTQAIEAFETHYRDHDVVGRMIRTHPGLRIPTASCPFEAITWAILGQQISLAAAISIRRRLIQAIGEQHSTGLICHPDPSRIAAIPVDELTTAGLSRTKASTLSILAQLMNNGTLDLDSHEAATHPGTVGSALMGIKGIGQWTVSYTLLRGYGYLDGSLHGDAALRRSMQMQPGLPATVSEDYAKEWLAQFSPWRALVAAHLWAMLGVQA